MQQEKIRVTDKRTLPFYIIPKTLLRNHKPSYKAILAYNALAYYSHGEQCRDISIRRLGEIVGVSEDTIKRGLKELETIRAIAVRKRFRRASGGNRMALPNEYTLVDVPEQTNVPI